jgi:integrase
MGGAGVLDCQKIRERIAPTTTFREQAAWWIAEVKAGRIVHAKKRTQIRSATIIGYETGVNYLNKQIGDMPLISIDNPEAKTLVAKMRLEVQDDKPRFADKTIVEYFSVMQRVIKSAVDDKLKQLYPRDWDLSAICLPRVNPKNQHRPTLSRREVSDIVSKSKGQYRVLFALLPGTGLRISEALGLEIKHLSSDRSIISVSQQLGKNGQVETYPKTDAGIREIDLDPSLAKMLRDFIGDRKEGYLFQTQNGTMFNSRNIYRDGLARVLKEIGRKNVRYHAFRRFRESVLLRSECRNILINFWIGHADSEMSSRYGKQLLEDVEFRQEWAKKVGLGFDLPTSEPALFGLRGLQKAEHLKQTEAA